MVVVPLLCRSVVNGGVDVRFSAVRNNTELPLEGVQSFGNDIYPVCGQVIVVDAIVLYNARCVDATVKELAVIGCEDDGCLPTCVRAVAKLCNLVASLWNRCRVTVFICVAKNDVVVILSVYLSDCLAHFRDKPPIVLVAHVVACASRCIECGAHHLVVG